MRRSLLLVVPLFVGCRRAPQESPAPVPSASASASAPQAVASAPLRPRFAPPVAALLRGADVLVAGARRDDGALASTRRDVGGGEASLFPLPTLPDDGHLADVDWVSSAGAVGLVVDARSSVQALFAPEPSQLGASSWQPSDGGACAAGERLFAIGRADGGFALLSVTHDGARGTSAIPAGLSASLACSATRALVMVEDGGRRAARLVGQTEDTALALEDEERGFTLVPAGDAFLAVRLGARGLAYRVIGDKASPWVRVRAHLAVDETLELAVAGDDFVAVVLSRPVPAARPCSGDDVDAIAELLVFERASGAPRRDPERLDRWTCGADPGPFFGGVVGGKVVISWPRGASAACAKLGVRWGGLAWTATSGAGAAKITRIDAPAEEIVDAGCDRARCVLVALSRANEAGCLAASDAEAGEARVLTLTP